MLAVILIVVFTIVLLGVVFQKYYWPKFFYTKEELVSALKRTYEEQGAS